MSENRKKDYIAMYVMFDKRALPLGDVGKLAFNFILTRCVSGCVVVSSLLHEGDMTVSLQFSGDV